MFHMGIRDMYVTSFSSIPYFSNSEYWPLNKFHMETLVNSIRCPCWSAERSVRWLITRFGNATVEGLGKVGSSRWS